MNFLVNPSFCGFKLRNIVGTMICKSELSGTIFALASFEMPLMHLGSSFALTYETWFYGTQHFVLVISGAYCWYNLYNATYRRI